MTDLSNYKLKTKQLLKNMKQTLKYTEMTLIKVAILNIILMIVFNLMFVPAQEPIEQGLGLLAIIISLGGFCYGWMELNKIFYFPAKRVLEAIIGTVIVLANICYLMYYSFGLITWERDVWGIVLFGVGLAVILITNIEIAKV